VIGHDPTARAGILDRKQLDLRRCAAFAVMVAAYKQKKPEIEPVAA
jgi:hypothetical protein